MNVSPDGTRLTAISPVIVSSDGTRLSQNVTGCLLLQDSKEQDGVCSMKLDTHLLVSILLGLKE